MKDKRMVTHFFPYKGTPGHPIIKEHEAMAKDLISFIEKEKYWKWLVAAKCSSGYLYMIMRCYWIMLV